MYIRSVQVFTQSSKWFLDIFFWFRFLSVYVIQTPKIGSCKWPASRILFFEKSMLTFFYHSLDRRVKRKISNWNPYLWDNISTWLFWKIGRKSRGNISISITTIFISWLFLQTCFTITESKLNVYNNKNLVSYLFHDPPIPEWHYRISSYHNDHCNSKVSQFVIFLKLECTCITRRKNPDVKETGLGFCSSEWKKKWDKEWLLTKEKNIIDKRIA